MGREYRILSRLCRVYEPAPLPAALLRRRERPGGPVLPDGAAAGDHPPQAAPADQPIPPETVRRLCESLVDNLARLHSLDYRAAGLDDLGKPEGYVERQVTGWTRRYRDAQTDDLPGLERAAAWLAANRPAESGAALIHNDYKFDNLVLDPDDLTRIVAVLDWEMATIGDPLMDLGTTLGYWIEADDPEPLRRFLVGPTTLPGSLSRREVAERYGKTDRPRRPEHALLLRLRPVQDRRDRPADLRPVRPGSDQGPPVRRARGRRRGAGGAGRAGHRLGSVLRAVRQ